MAPRVGTDLTRRRAAVAHRRRVGAGARRAAQRRRLPDAGHRVRPRAHQRRARRGRQPPQLHPRLPDERRDARRDSRRSRDRCCARCSTRSASPRPRRRPTIAARCARPWSPALGTTAQRSRRHRQVARRARSRARRRRAARADAWRRGAIRRRRCTATRRCSTRWRPPPTRGRAGRALPLSLRARRLPRPGADRARAAAVAVAATAQPGHARSTWRGSSATPTRASARWRSSSDNWDGARAEDHHLRRRHHLIRVDGQVLRRAVARRDHGVLRRAQAARGERARSTRRSSGSTTASRCARSRRPTSTRGSPRAEIRESRRHAEDAPDTAWCPATHARHGWSVPTRMPMRGPQAIAPMLDAAVFDVEPIAEQIEPVLRQRDPHRHRQVAGAAAESRACGSRRRPAAIAALSSRARAGGASRRCRRADRARGSAPPPANPCASVTTLTRQWMP